MKARSDAIKTQLQVLAATQLDALIAGRWKRKVDISKSRYLNMYLNILKTRFLKPDQELCAGSPGVWILS
jgi:hypothetical protein